MRTSPTRSLLAVLGVICVLAPAGLAQNKPKTAKPKKPPTYDKLIKSVEETVGKPLTDRQKADVRAAAEARGKAMKPIQEKFKADVAKAVGMSTDQYMAKLKANRKKKADAMKALKKT